MEQFLQIGLRVPDAVQEQQDHPGIQARITMMDMTMLVAHFVVHRIVRVAKTVCVSETHLLTKKMSLFTHEKTGCPWDEKDSAIRSAPKTI